MRRTITGFSNPTVKHLRSLRDKKHRKRERKFLAEGLRLLTDARETGHLPETLVMATGREPHPLHGTAHRPTLVGQLAQSRTHEHPDPLVRSSDHGVRNPSHVAVIPQHPKVVKDPAGHGAS